MNDRKNLPTDASVEALIDAAPANRQADTREVLDLMRQVTGTEPVVWGSSMVGFGRQPYTTADGKEREWFAVGLSPRKAALTFYGLTCPGSDDDLLDRLGPHTTSKSCLYVKRLDGVDRTVLTELVERAWRDNHRPA
ncbi:conserved hypothetical protein [metagenome]|uniref:YdhG-like domain-containing protein n=1 Tax=metagenome TaxID=256318 RepID=A0A2P2C9B4_9ZZZZ